jgi:3,4-dihydroxy 2-butanone 4-phosphate synthase / GTP cyclohydrolase II
MVAQDGVSFDGVDQAIAGIAAGKPVIVVDHQWRENEGDLIFAAEHATSELVAFMLRHTGDFICVALTSEDCARLELPPMCAVNETEHGTAFAVPVDARSGVSSGISAADRAQTLRVLGTASTTAADLVRPGHMVPVRAAAGGVLERPGHTEAALDLTHLAGCSPAAALCTLVNDDGTVRSLTELRRFADEHELRMISIADLIDYIHGMRSSTAALADTHGPSAPAKSFGIS